MLSAELSYFASPNASIGMNIKPKKSNPKPKAVLFPKTLAIEKRIKIAITRFAGVIYRL
jgi:hypothetical protein